MFYLHNYLRTGKGTVTRIETRTLRRTIYIRTPPMSSINKVLVPPTNKQPDTLMYDPTGQDDIRRYKTRRDENVHTVLHPPSFCLHPTYLCMYVSRHVISYLPSRGAGGSKDPPGGFPSGHFGRFVFASHLSSQHAIARAGEEKKIT